MKILVVDDDDDMREVMTFILERAGHKVRAANNGRDAIRIGRSTAPDLVFTDIGMPDLDGRVVAQLLRRTHPKMRIFLATGWMHVAREASPYWDGVLRKPVDVDDLLRLVGEESAVC